MSSLRNVLDTPFTSIPVSWRTLLQHVHVVDSDVNLERLLSETENADAFSQISIDTLGEASELIEPILE